MLDYKHESMSVAQFQRDYHSIDCQPVGQRLPVYTKDNSKEVGIIQTLLDGESIGMITIMELSSNYNRSQRRAFEKIFKRESIDGGHRKRAIWAFLNDEFRVGGFLFSEMEQSVKDDFLETELMFTVYKPLSTEKKGRILLHKDIIDGFIGNDNIMSELMRDEDYKGVEKGKEAKK